MSTRATVKVRLVVEVEVSSAWGGDCPMHQVHSQGVAAARGTIERALRGEASDSERRRVKVVAVDALEMTVTDER